MADVSASLVKELRERTGLGMMECKKALVEANGNIETAADNLRKSGAAKADKKAGRTAAEGAVIIASAGNVALMIEINSETDFVAKDDNFQKFAKNVANAALAAKETDIEKIKTLKIEAGSVEEARAALVQKIGENIQIRRAVLVKSDGVLATYLHGSKIGVLVTLKGGNEAIGKDIAMHVAASNPLVLTGEQVSPEVLEREKNIIRAQPDMAGKPAEIVEKMMGGRIKKFLKDVSLVDQPFVKNPEQSVAQFAKAGGAEILSFTRFEVGEGIEVTKVDFAEEVKAQAKAGA
jgi:elongation factor Ts